MKLDISKSVLYVIAGLCVIISTMIVYMGCLTNVVNSLKEHHIKIEGYSYPIDCIREAELSYWDYKYKLTNEVQRYIDSIASTSNLRGYAIVEQCEKYNVDIKFVLTQAEIESHFGTKGIGSKLNNVFNVGVFDGYSAEKVSKNFKYEYPNESIEPYLKLLTENYLVGKLETDLMDNYVDTNGKRYASDEEYETKFKSKYNLIISSTKIDEYYSLMKSYAIKCNR